MKSIKSAVLLFGVLSIMPSAAQAQGAAGDYQRESRGQAPIAAQQRMQASGSLNYGPRVDYGRPVVGYGAAVAPVQQRQIYGVRSYYSYGPQSYPQYAPQTQLYPAQSGAYIPMGAPAYIPLAGSSVLAGYPYGTAPLPGQPSYASAYPGYGYRYGQGDNRRYGSDYFYGGGYDYPYYCPADYGDNVYQSVYSLYGGFPAYFYVPDNSLIILDTPPVIFAPAGGEYYPFNVDPYEDSVDVAPYGLTGASSGLPQVLSAPFTQLGEAWATHNMGLLDQYLPAGDQHVAIAFNGNYKYSLGANDYRLMTRDAMSRLATSDFRYTDASVRRDGDATAYAVQQYRTPAGATGTVYLAYTLRPDHSAASGYRLVGVNTSIHPQTARQRAFQESAASNQPVRSYGN